MNELLGSYNGLWALVPIAAALGVLGLVLLARGRRPPARRKFRAPWR